MTSYRDAGVDLDGASRHVASISEEVRSTWTENVVGVFGGFAAGVEIPPDYDNPVLMMSTDGVGTKLDLARRAGVWDMVGADLVAMCVDDLAAVGAEPLGFVDYMAVGSLRPERDATIVRSVARACREAGCALLGGETAEHPGVMEPDAVDLAGAVMGVVEKGRQLGPHLVRDGDQIVGLLSPNLRSNGFSLVREVLGDDIENHAAALLEPSVIYSPTVLEAVATGGVHAAAHITGGGIAGNLGRVVPEGLGATVDTSAWQIPAVFDLVSDRGVEQSEMFRTFNMGIGFCIVVEPGATSDVLAAIGRHHPTVIGRISNGGGVTLT
ncbi:MAG: phosphoribosylformylglycinamidine cyclo-ligase [Acidobacteria bacterium]|nr:phosphoribosylformylglycinamidine cyclo-ligase [Acidobacteriota bacterium]